MGKKKKGCEASMSNIPSKSWPAFLTQGWHLGDFERRSFVEQKNLLWPNGKSLLMQGKKKGGKSDAGGCTAALTAQPGGGHFRS